MFLKRILTSSLKDSLEFSSTCITVCFIKRLIEFIFKEVSIMDYYKVVSPRGGVVCVTHIKGVAKDVLKMFPSNYKIEVIKGNIYLLDDL